MLDDQAALLLFEDADIRSVKIIRRPRNVHLLSTVAWLRGLQEIGIIASADDVVRAMTHRRIHRADPASSAIFRRGVDDLAEIESNWRP